MGQSLVQRVIRYHVFSLDMWGHVSADCCQGYGCPCMVKCPDCDEGIQDCDQCASHVCDTCKGKETIHDDNACECHEDMNNRHKVGTIQVRESDSDSLILQTLRDDEYLSDEGLAKCSIEDCNGMGEDLDIVDKEGRRIFQLERVEG